MPAVPDHPTITLNWASATRIELIVNASVAASVWHVHNEGWHWCLGDTAATAAQSGGPTDRGTAVHLAIDAIESGVK